MIRHIHFDPVGGAAGDMFVAAMLQTFPQLLTPCLDDLGACGVLEHVDVKLETGKSQSLAVQRFHVQHKSEIPRATGHYRDLIALLEGSVLDANVLKRALSLFRLLGEAESRVHGVPLDDVHFHEVADWDSVADIVAAASIIERCGVRSWSCAALPVGSGLVKTEHGLLPVPAPATLVLLEGLPSWDDGEPGERVTPTGAAIIRYLLEHDLSKSNVSMRPPGCVIASGMGAGKRSLNNKPNVLRCTLVEVDDIDSSKQSIKPSILASADFEHELDQVAQITFAIDDMNSEELAVALQFIRQSDGVFDVSHQVSFGKKGRMMFDVTVLCLPGLEPTISRQCFSETSTLGLRVQIIERRILKREQFTVHHEMAAAGVKQVKRPLATEASDGPKEHLSLKVESNDVRRIPGLYERRRRAADISDRALSVQKTTDNSNSDNHSASSEPSASDSTRFV